MEPLLLASPTSDRPAGSDVVSSPGSAQSGSMESLEDPNAKKRRRKNAKSRTGCLTW
jgi:hypothetical protein